MIKAASLFTQEIDNISLACSQIKKQLDNKLSLLRSTVGIVQCSPEFIENGMLERLYRELNIPLAGGTTAASATNDAVSNLMFSVLVLTSDDVEFVVSHTEGFENNCMDSVNRSLKEMLLKSGQLSQEPLKMVLVFPPIIDTVAGDSYIEVIEGVYGKVPVFGTLSVDDSLDNYDHSASICNDRFFKREMTYVLLFGNVTPRFSIATVPRQAGLGELDAVITKASGNIVYEINNMRTIDYFESIGLAGTGKLKGGSHLIPLLMTAADRKDEIPFVRALIRINDDGSALLRGKVNEGTRVAFGSTLGSDVMSSTCKTITGLGREKNTSAALFFSCIVRQFVIGADSTRELAQVKDLLAPDIPFMAACAGGEIAPTSVDSENTAQNRFHNYSFITCLL